MNIQRICDNVNQLLELAEETVKIVHGGRLYWLAGVDVDEQGHIQVDCLGVDERQDEPFLDEISEGELRGIAVQVLEQVNLGELLTKGKAGQQQ